ncbi:MAG TPA: ZIP family metal transporter [Flavilitoribacter sp.]|nr:ZIP family metal transporter [Flavilitoribacter sp.]
MTLWGYLLLISVVAGGGLVGYYLHKKAGSLLPMVLSFSGAYILGITVLHLLPEVMTGASHKVGYWLLAGFFVQLLLEQLSQGVEHGHIHGRHHARKGFAVQVMAGLCLHAFIEGMPLSHYGHLHEAVTHGADHLKGTHLLIGVALHKAPAAFALAALLLHSGFRKTFVFTCLGCFALMSPLGALLSSLMTLSLDQIQWLLAFVIGSFLHISTTILFESDSPGKHAISFRKVLTILLGLGFSLATTLL